MIEVRFQVTSIDELKSDVSQLVEALGWAPAPAPETTGVKTPTPVPTPAPAPAPAPIPAPPYIPQPEPAAPSMAPHGAAPAYTQDQIAVAGVSLMDAGKLPQLQALLAEFGVQAVTQLQPGQYGAFATRLRALGAQI